MSNLDAKRLAEAIKDFTASDLGQDYLTALGLQYNGLHHAAESEDLSIEQKAMKIERAAGVKWAIDYLTSRETLLDQGYYKKKV